jgi:putative salt-induced outer membrane protein YdiY
MRLLVVVVCLVSLPVAQADQLTVKNGDRISGSIVTKDAKTLTIKSEVFGPVTVPWDQVQSITADQPVNIVLSTGETLRGTLRPREEKIEIEASGTRREVALAEITTLRDAGEQRAYERLEAPGVRDLWAGTATLGFAGTQGNAKTRTLAIGLNAARVTRSDKTAVYFNAIRASARINGVSADTAQAIRGGWGYSHNLSSRLFANGFNDYEYDRFQNLDLRFVLGGGLGYIAWKGESARLDLLGGGAYNHESFSPVAPAASFTRNSAEAYFGDDFTYKMTAVTALYQSARFFPNLSNTGEYRLNFDVGASTKLAKWLVWNLAISDRLLSNPAPGRQKNDLLYTTSIGVTFAR